MIEELRDGLILRSLDEGVASDRENLGSFYRHVFQEHGEDDAFTMADWVADLLDVAHPTMTPENFFVVVDPQRDAPLEQGGQIVSAVLLIPQTWQYGDVSFGVGRVELVATHKDYRRRGLVRKLIDAAHTRSVELHHLVNGITGIPHYYRRFGYAMAIDLGSRGRVQLTAIKPLKDGETPTYRLRLATVDDADLLAEWDAYRAEQSAVAHVRTAKIWQYEIVGRRELATMHVHVFVIETTDGQPVGHVALKATPGSSWCAVFSYVVGSEASYLATFGDILRDLKTHVQRIYADDTQHMPTEIEFDSGVHPSVDRLIAGMRGVVNQHNYAWYIRVPDVVRFLETIKPVLEQRLIGSGAHCYTGSLKIGFYDLTGVEMTFERGEITNITARPFDQEEEDAGFPYHAFLNVMFGHRTRDELAFILPETFANTKARILLDAMFPKQRSYLYPLP